MSVLAIRDKLDEIKIKYENGHRKVKCFCGKICTNSIVPHMKQNHPEVWNEWSIGFAKLRNAGFSYYSIIKKFKTKDDLFIFTSRVVEHEIQRLTESGRIEIQIPRKERINEWQPKDFRIERVTSWSFKDRGSWAVHQGDYRGNWSPYVPRTLIELYSREEEIVLDPFVGGGTTLIEAWLTNRHGFGLDVSPLAIATTTARIQEMVEKSSSDPRINLRKDLMPTAIQGDARELKSCMEKIGIKDNSVKLVCAHPPYLDSLRYTVGVNEDLSHISDPVKFCDQLQQIARQMFDLLRDDGICAVLIGDVRKNQEIVPLGFFVLERFLKEDFKIKEIMVKMQHKDSSTRFWYTKRSKLDFLISHEYLFVFRK